MRVLLIVTGLAVAACTGPTPEPADFVLTNVRGATITADGLQRFDTVAIADGRFVATGAAADLLARFANAPITDGGGRSMLPGLIDAHGHVSSLGVVTESINLAGVDSLTEALSIVRDFAGEHPDRQWITGRGWNQVLWEGGAFPTRQQLDAIEPDRPIWLGRIDGHAAWGNSAALAAAGVDRDTIDPAGGRILRDENGEPTGVFVDAAMDLVEAAIPANSDADVARYIEAALAELARLGITSVHDAGVSLQETRVLRELADANRMPVRVYAMLSGAGAVLDGFGEPLLDYADGRLSIRSVKLYADGALGSRGAALIDEYSDEPGNRGLLFGDEDTIASLIRKSNEAGFQANVHAIGDLANRVVLQAFAEVQGNKPSPLRNRIEHAQIVPVELIGDFAKLGVVASMQPTHATSDMNMAEDRIGSLRIRGAYAWRTMLEQGAILAAGSDFPVESANPMYGLHAAVTRTDHSGAPVGGWYPEQALTREEALRAFTIDAAYAAHQENELGQIAPGFRADFILLDRDYLTMPAAELYTLSPAETWVAGERVYARGATR
ncbi:MAG: amidohydrolase [Pseudomonadota bacterium]